MAYCSKGRVCITLKKTSQLKSYVEVTPKENFDFAEALESVYPLLEIVFSYLDYNDLQIASLVKRSWHQTAKKILRKRNEISWITVFRKKRQSYIHYSHNYPYNNISLGIIFFNYRAVSLSDFFCCHENLSQRKIKFSDFLAGQVVPYGVKYCVIGCPSVTSLFSKKVINKASVPLFDSCFIPTIPNVRISMFYCNPIHMKDDYIRSNEKLKCLLLFCKNDLEDSIYTIFEHLLPEERCQDVAVGGGIIRKTLLFPQQASEGYKFRKLNNLCIAFAEDVGCESVFDTGSMVINGNNLSCEEFEDELIKFKKRTIIRQNSLAFRVCCAAKMRKSHESRVFNKIFPDTPLLGMEAEGEIGWDCFNLPSDQGGGENEVKKSKRGYPTVQHQWSTIIVFITWGNVISKK